MNHCKISNGCCSTSDTKSEIPTIAHTGPPLSETLQLLAPLANTLEVLNLSANSGIGYCEIPGQLLAPFTKLTSLGLAGMKLQGAEAPEHPGAQLMRAFAR